MATLDAVRRVFVLLEDCGYAFSGPSVDRTAQAWVRLTRHTSDELLEAAAESWMQQDNATFRQWPVPGGA